MNFHDSNSISFFLLIFYRFAIINNHSFAVKHLKINFGIAKNQ